MDFSCLWKEKKTTVSFEYFPARNEESTIKLQQVCDKLFLLNPDFVSVTFGAGGSSRDGSYQLLNTLLQKNQSKVIGYIAGDGLSHEQIHNIVHQYTNLGVHALFCVRGDKSGDSETNSQEKTFSHACDLLSYIKKISPLCIGAAGYPEGHSEAESFEQDVDYLKFKVDCGASFIISQYFYDNQYFFNFVESCRKRGITVPIVAGIMPIYSIKLTKNLAVQCGASIPETIMKRFSLLNPEDKQAIEDFGVEYSLIQCRELLEKGVNGLHFYTMDRSQSVSRIITQLRKEGFMN